MPDVYSTIDYERDKKVVKAIQLALDTIAPYLEGEAIVRQLPDTGRLRGSITYATRRVHDEIRDKALPGDGVKPPRSEWEAVIGTNVEYAEYVEYGTRYMAAKPYMRPALDANRGVVRRMLQDEVAKVF